MQILFTNTKQKTKTRLITKPTRNWWAFSLLTTIYNKNDNMKNLVLTRKQLNEVVTTLNVGFDGNGVDSQEVQNAVNIGKRSGDYNIKVSNKTQTGPKNDNDLPVVSFDVQGDPNASEMMGLIDKQPGVKNSLTNGEAAVQFNTTQEELQYTKKQIEEMRINNIKKNGKVMTKQQLQEEFDSNSKL